MNNTQNEVLKGFAAMLIRWAILLVGSWLIQKNLIDQPTLDSLTTPEILAALVGVVSVALVTLFGWWKIRYNDALPKAALQAEPGTNLEVVKAEVKSKLTTI